MTTNDRNRHGDGCSQKMRRVTLVGDREGWALASLGERISSRLASEAAITSTVTSLEKLYTNPWRELLALRQAEVVHWLDPYCYKIGRGLVEAAQVVTIHHIEIGATIDADTYSNVSVLAPPGQTLDMLTSLGFVDVTPTPYVVDLERFRPRNQAACRATLKLDAEVQLIGFFGKESSNLHDRKGTQLLVATLQKLGNGSPPELVLGGEGWSNLITVLRSAGIRVHDFRGACDALMPILYSCLDVYLCTSTVEGGPLPVLEAMAAGVCVVSTPVGQVGLWMQDGVSGYIRDSWSGVVSALSVLLADVEFRRTVGVAARHSAERYSDEAALTSTVDVYKRLLGGDGVETTVGRGAPIAAGQFVGRLLLHHLHRLHNNTESWLRIR